MESSSTVESPYKGITIHQPTGTARTLPIVGLDEEVSLIQRKIGPTKSSVLIIGDSGTGKDLLAREVHDASDRSKKPFVIVSCSSITANQGDILFFGFVSPSGKQRNKGVFEQAQSGTLFLDDIDDLSLTAQTHIMHILEKSQIYPLGASRPVAIDCRIVATTNKDIDSLVQGGRFRNDLYQRLVLKVTPRPLRERVDEIPALAHFFLKRYSGGSIEKISEPAIECLKQYVWPGNVRELEGVIERCCVLADGDAIEVANLPSTISYVDPLQGSVGDIIGLVGGAIREAYVGIPRMNPVGPHVDIPATVEMALYVSALNRMGHNTVAAAKLLGVPHRTMLAKLRRHKIAVR